MRICTEGFHLPKQTTTLSGKLLGYIIPLRRGAEISVGCCTRPARKAKGAHHTLDVCHVGGRKLGKVLPCILQCSFLSCRRTYMQLLQCSVSFERQ